MPKIEDSYEDINNIESNAHYNKEGNSKYNKIIDKL